MNGTAPISDVNSLPVVSPAVAAQIKAWAMAQGGPVPATPAAGAVARLPAAAPVGLQFATQPGVERWPVKTGTDADAAEVGKNVFNGVDLGAGIVPATVEELIGFPRSADMTPPTAEFPAYQDHRREPVEATIWQVDVEITALKLEQDGDYHLVFRGATGQTMIGEIPTPYPPYVQASSPFLANIQTARQAIDDRLVSPLSPANFAPLNGTLVPREALSAPSQAPSGLPGSFRTPSPGAPPLPTFQTKVPATRVRITGVGFFDRVHNQMGVALLNGIELHPVLKVEWL